MDDRTNFPFDENGAELDDTANAAEPTNGVTPPPVETLNAAIPMPPPVAPPSTPPQAPPSNMPEDDGLRMNERLERLGGEPAPTITPEEFARLQKAGQVHIDARGRVRTARRSDAEAGVSLRKRRAWYGI
ncbi:MAG: hypothetical protein H7175_10145 [Burkholderiales bacterium]|nr:hypothetical protein [Anaerolineae bacterium]